MGEPGDWGPGAGLARGAEGGEAPGAGREGARPRVGAAARGTVEPGLGGARRAPGGGGATPSAGASACPPPADRVVNHLGSPLVRPRPKLSLSCVSGTKKQQLLRGFNHTEGETLKSEKHLKWVYWAAREVRVSVRKPPPSRLPCDLERSVQAPPWAPR